MSYIRSFHEVGADSIGLVGGKGANLGEMTRAGLPVPPGFCVTAQAYRDFLAGPAALGAMRSFVEDRRDEHAETSSDRLGRVLAFTKAHPSPSVGEFVRMILVDLRPDDPSCVETIAGQVREFLEAQPVPPDIAAEVLERYRLLNGELGLDPGTPAPVAVRSSATAEDLPTASFAGQQDTYLNIVGEDKLLQFVKSCWASLWTGRAVSYRIRQGFDHAQVALAVVVQSMIPSETSGILFTANPVSGDPGEAVVNASWGLGEAVVGGLVTPDTFTVDKVAGTVTSTIIGSKERMLEHTPGGGYWEHAVPAERREIPCLSGSQLLELVELGNRIEDHYGAPMDIEWAWAGGRFYVLQARAITTLKTLAAPAVPAADARALFAERVAAARGEYSRAMFVELFPDPLSPSFLSTIAILLKGMVDYTFTTLGLRPPADPALDAVGTFYCQPFFHREYIEATLAPLTPAVRQRFAAQVMNPWGDHGHGVSTEFSPAFARFMAGIGWFMVTSPRWMPKIIDKWRTEIKALEAEPVESKPARDIMLRIRTLVDQDIAGLLNCDFLLIILIGITYRLLGSLLKRHVGEQQGEELKTHLVSGVTGNATMTINKRLWDLAQTAKASRVVTTALRAGGDPRNSLAGVPEARPFLDELHRLLVDFGHRESRMDILYPPWCEDPAPALAFVRGYLDMPESKGPHGQEARLIQEREEATAAALSAFRGDLRSRVFEGPLFRWVLKSALGHTRERDTMHFELTRMLHPFRRMLLELGRRWTESGLVDAPDDVFYLTLDELTLQAAQPQAVQDLIRRRRVDYEASRRFTAPVTIIDGKEIYPEGANPDETGAGSAGRCSGIAGSSGRATGPARIIMGPEDFGKLKPGDILVAPLTTPTWTPLFAMAGGLVTEVGGILSHGAIVAREYGIPAVMAVAKATQVFQDGQTLTVDGDKGTVSME